MATFFQSVRQGFGRQSNRGNGNGNNSNNQPKANGSQNSSPTTFTPPPNSTTNSPSLPSMSSSDTGMANVENHPGREPPKPFFFREKYATLGVKGNFMPLAAQPRYVDLGEWLAHQAVEQYRLLEKELQCIQEVDTNTGSAICNEKTCPTMSAGSHRYTWLTNERTPVEVSASKYITLVQRWIVAKLHDPNAFPTDAPTGTESTYASGGVNTPGATTPIPMRATTLTTPLSTLAGRDWVGKAAGFPETFFGDLKTIFRQIFRVYAHLYYSHWENPFWHINAHRDLNSTFVHFITVAMLFGLLSTRDMEPMQPLIDIWIANGSIPADAANGACAIVPSQ
ncbi:Mob1/phocein [Lasallia pustulata]|nr:Mob1/phocein [Lasallia pustulata]